jgi:hypothetical protein
MAAPRRAYSQRRESSDLEQDLWHGRFGVRGYLVGLNTRFDAIVKNEQVACLAASTLDFRVCWLYATCKKQPLSSQSRL